MRSTSAHAGRISGWSALGLPAGSRESEKERWPQSELSWGPIHPEHGIYDVAVASRR